MNPLDALASNSQQVNDSLLRNYEAMPEEKRDWRPLDLGRSALDQLRECAVVNGWAAEILRSGAVPKIDFTKENEALSDPHAAIAAFRRNSGALTDAIRSLAPESFGNQVTLPWSKEPTTLFECTLLGYWNSSYHLGQISFIQTLYGDNEMH
ncbi:MAG TPA: DinB family protein [Fimbriimonadaceae bacterium]|nr:DinB family protein [Fimbriimonadaceae bacterium]